MHHLPEIDSHYIYSLRAGDEFAFREVFRFYHQRLYSFAFRFLKDKEQTEEIIQEVFLRLWLGREKVDPEKATGSLLYTMTRRLTLNSLRDIANSQKLRENVWRSIEEGQNSTEESVFVSDLEHFIADFLLTLPQQQQLIFRLSRHEGLSHDEIAERLHISPNTVKNHLVRALHKLRVQVKQIGFWIAVYLFCFF